MVRMIGQPSNDLTPKPISPTLRSTVTRPWQERSQVRVT
jgi:hypothetical protein